MKPGRTLIVLTVVVVAAGTAVVLGETPIQRPAFVDRIEYPLDYGGLVRTHAARNRLDSALVAAVIYEESRFRPRALSKLGAMGLMQIQPVTGETIANRTGGTGFRVSDLYDPDINIRYGSWYLANLFRKYRDERLVLAAYNAGQGNVDRWLAAREPVQFPETRAYIRRVEQLKSVYRSAWGHDLGYG